MAESLGNAYINIVPKAPGIEGKISGLLGGPAGAAGERAGKKAGGGLLRALGGIVSIAAVGKVLKSAFEAGGKLEQSFGGLDTIYGSAAGQAKEFAMQAAAAGISANSYAEQAVSFGASLRAAFGGDTEAAMNAANTAILDMADNAAKMGTPLESIQAAYQGFAKGNYTMLDNLKLGYGGTQSEMERLLADAEKISGVKYDISNLGNVYDAIHVIQGELGLTGVAASEAATTLSGSFGAMKASWENVLGALMTGEGLDAAMENFSTSVGNFANNVLKMFSALAPQIPALIQGLADAVIQNAPQFIASGAQLIIQLAVGLVQSIPDIVAKVPEIFKGIKSAFSKIDWASLGRDLINGIIKGLVSAATGLYNKVREIITSALNKGKETAEVGSPSRLFAREIGRWIPPGVAVGIEGNMDPLNTAITGMTDSAIDQFDRVSGAGVAGLHMAGSSVAIDYDRLAAAINSRPIVIEGDTGKIFRIVKNENLVRTRATNYNVLAAPLRT